ncbi:MAG: glycosyltransferase family 2 protein [Eubacterium sp.]|nr:glycosyltransferase family 2 protein [Eubacterium sp.]
MSIILSVIVPCYNCERFLDEALGSLICEQVQDRLEVIAVDDGSPDNCADIVNRYCDKYPGVFRLISQENKGHGGALNTGLAAAAGKYLKVIDADDSVITENLPAFIAELEKTDADVVLTHHITRNVLTGEIKKWKSYPEKFGVKYTFDEIMNSWKSFDRSLTFHGITYRRDFYQAHCIQLSEHVFYEDHEYATVPCCYADSILPLDLFIYSYRIGDVQQSVSDENQLKRLSHTEAVLDRLIAEYALLSPVADGAGKRYYAMKAQGLLLSYIITALLVEKDRKKGRRTAAAMMEKFRSGLPDTYAMAEKQYKVFRMMNRLHFSKRTWERISGSRLYNRLRKNHSFE